MHNFIEILAKNPIIAAVQSRPALEKALAFGIPTVFLLNTDIFSAKVFVDMASKENCYVFLHMDLIEGLASGAKALDYVQKHIQPSGIISTKTALVKYAREQGVFCIQRFYMVDSTSFDESIKIVRKTKPSVVELMPGIIPDVISQFISRVDTPVIAGGLITKKQQVISALSSGAIGISSGNQTLWQYKHH